MRMINSRYPMDRDLFRIKNQFHERTTPGDHWENRR